MKVLVIDFDGTIVFDKYPQIGEMKPNCKVVINYLHDAKGYKIIINTCRCDQYATEAFAWLTDQEIKFDAFNENLPEMVVMYDGADPRKISGSLYIDDKNLGGAPDNWLEIYELIIERLGND